MVRRVFVISNDIVPAQEMPVAAPGLRAFGLAEGLRAHGFEVKTVLTRGFAERQWFRFGSAVPHPTAPDTVVVAARRLAGFLGANSPAAAIMINSNQADHLRPVEGVRYVLDFFAPKMLETLYQRGEEYPAEELELLRERKLRAIRLADAFIVNGEKKVPYFLAWLLQAGRDVRHLPFEVVNMCVPLAFGGGEPEMREGVRFAIAGYLQQWGTLGAWVGELEGRLDRPGVSLDLLTPWHWGGNVERTHASKGDLDRIAAHPSVTVHGQMRFSDFRRFLTGVDVAIDLFEHNLEREYAMVTRSVVALACGVPVVHPPFTEVSRMISRYDAGWLVDPARPREVGRVFDEIIANPEEVYRKKKNARTLARELVDPEVAVEPLARILEGI